MKKTTPPTLTCDSDKIVASVDETSDDFLLKGVKAYDDRSGDVSDTLMVQSISNFIQKNTVIVTYAAVDEGNNVGRLERTLIYTDYKEPVFKLKSPLLFTTGTNVPFLRNISADSSIDGNLTTQIRYGLDSIVDNNTPAAYPITFRVTDSNGKTSYLETEIVILSSIYASADISLKDYLIYIPKNSEFNEKTAEKYISSVSVEYEKEELTIDCPVDTKTPGIYHVDYTLNTNKVSGKTRLIVVVESD